VNWQAGSGLRLPEATAEIIASIGEHRILSTAQVRAIHYPDRGLRRTQQALAYLEQAGLVAHVERRGSPRRVWFLTEAGADAVILAGDVKERPKVLTPKQAAGPLTAHTLGAGLAKRLAGLYQPPATSPREPAAGSRRAEPAPSFS
jgi:protein involved in plasmid replication-relaxation